jgi:hypothetical protein
LAFLASLASFILDKSRLERVPSTVWAADLEFEQVKEGFSQVKFAALLYKLRGRETGH